MNAIMRRIRFLGCAALLAGCISAQNTRLPTLRPSAPAVTDRDAYVYHNPLPDVEAGPAVERPRGFERQRSDPARTQERSAITDAITGGGGNNPSASKYPGSVNP